MERDVMKIVKASEWRVSGMATAWLVARRKRMR